MAKEGKNNNEIFAKTGWFRDKVTGEMKFNFSDKDMDIISKNYEIGKEYTLKEILKHDTLFEIYTQLKDYKVVIEDMNANKEKKTIGGDYNRYTDKIRLDYRRFNKKSDVEGTLIHEIQHAIQKIENFSRDASTVWEKNFQKKSPGEIEAKDMSTRLIEEKYNGKSLNNIMPKSGNIKVPILDKMKIGLYNYISDKKRNKKGGIKNDEVISENEGKNTQYNSKNNNLVLGGINKNSINTQGAWQSFLENQIGPTGKGKTVQELRLPTKENWDIVKSQNTINQNNKGRLKDIGITENNDLITNSNDEDVGEENIAQVL